jgi:diacylglycerol kinase family enzyme
MRILLIDNPKAGVDDRVADIRRLIKAAGHELHVAAKKSDIRARLPIEPDLIVVAGGDGTVCRVARQVAGQEIPLTILPVGTANNVARSLGIEGHPVELIARWLRGRVVPLDGIAVTHPGGEDLAFESTGFGLFTEAMCLAKDRSESDAKFTAEERFDRDFRLLRRIAGTLTYEACTIELDDDTIQGDLILCAAMNIRQIGSRLVLAPEAVPGDGRFDLVIVTEDDRELLMRFLDRDPEDDHPPHLPTRRVSRARMISSAERIHLDDKIRELPKNTTHWKADLVIQPGTVKVLVPDVVMEESAGGG